MGHAWGEQTAEERRRLLIRRIAEQAYAQPLLEGGLWFYGDIRNNFYYASYLFAATVDETLPVSFDRRTAAARAQAVLLEVLALQNTVPGTPLYGHWPLGLAPVPREAKPHELPAELMGSLLAVFRRRYGERLDSMAAVRLDAALGHVYRGGFYRKPLARYHHHEAKYTAAKLIFGLLFDDRELLADGRDCVKRTLAHLRANGMEEYGGLPWFWHWVQAFAAALEFAAEAEGEERTASDLRALLNELWRIRADWYLGGAWVGAHSRGWPHDVPRDVNVLHDYVQFGGFPLPEELPRTEYAGLLFYPAPPEAMKTALDRSRPTELRKRIVPVTAAEPWHSYAYIRAEYAAGGLWERVEEFDNEQLRWAFTLPVRADGSVNRLYFFHPGRGYADGDPRHQSGRMAVLYDRSVVAAWFPGPDARDAADFAVGVLPAGSWLERPNALYGRCDEALFAVYLSGPYTITERDGWREVRLAPLPGGVVVEALAVREAEKRGIADLEAFAAVMEVRRPVFAGGSVADGEAPAAAANGSGGSSGPAGPAAALDVDGEADHSAVVRYRSLQGGGIALLRHSGPEESASWEARRDGVRITLDNYEG